MNSAKNSIAKSQSTHRRNSLSPLLLRLLFRYQPHTGLLIWRVTRSNRAPAGSVAGSLSKGYRWVEINGRQYGAHRLVWAYHKGSIPVGMEIDHVDRDRANSRIENLRLATSSQNNVNKATRNALGLKGVKKNGSKYQARIRVDGRRVYLGSYDTAEEAHEVYLKKAREIYGEFVSQA